MKKSIMKLVLPMLTVLCASQTVFASSDTDAVMNDPYIKTAVATSATVGTLAAPITLPSQVTKSTGEAAQRKVILEAKEDASMFIVSEGRVRGASLQKALEVIRSNNATLRASDLDLAQEILAAE